MSIRHLATKFSEIWIKTKHFSFKNMSLKITSAKWRPCWISPNVRKNSSMRRGTDYNIGHVSLFLSSSAIYMYDVECVLTDQTTLSIINLAASCFTQSIASSRFNCATDRAKHGRLPTHHQTCMIWRHTYICHDNLNDGIEISIVMVLHDSPIWINRSICAWWRHQMKTVSALLVVNCEGKPPFTGFQTQSRS